MMDRICKLLNEKLGQMETGKLRIVPVLTWGGLAILPYGHRLSLFAAELQPMGLKQAAQDNSISRVSCTSNAATRLIVATISRA